MNRHGELVIVDDTGREREHARLVYGAELKKNDGEKVKPGDRLAEWDQFATPILTEGRHREVRRSRGCHVQEASMR
jgi:DNA-directed RNA polymerase subunit beta'